MKKALIIGFVAIVAVVGVLVYTFFESLDAIVEAGVERYGSEITQTRVRLGRVEIKLADGQGTLRRLDIGNPKGFHSDHSIQLGEIKLVLDVETVTKKVIVIKEILIDQPTITYELGAGGSNIDAIQKNVEAYVGPSEQASADEGAQGPKFIIENLSIRGGKVSVSAAALGGRELSAALPDIHLKDIGKGTGGATPGEVTKLIMARLTRGVDSAVGPLHLEKVLGVGLEGVPGAKGVLEKGAGGLGKGGEETGRTIKEGVGGAGRKLKKLF